MSTDTATKGRPSTFTQEIADEICERLSSGEPLAVICRSDHMPAYRTVYDWQKANEAFSASIACAREDGFDMIAAGTRLTARGEGDSKADVQRDKLIIDTDLKLLAKWSPKRYGDRLELGGNLTLNHEGALDELE